MAQRGYTTKECPACKENKKRRADDLCPDCLALIENGKRYNEFYEKMINSKNGIEASVPASWCKPRYYVIGLRQISDKKADQVGETITKLAITTSIEKPVTVAWSYLSYLENRLSFEADERGAREQLFNQRFDWRQIRVFDKEVFQLLNTLNDQITELVENAYKDGLENGKNALLMLNSGEMSMEDFENYKH